MRASQNSPARFVFFFVFVALFLANNLDDEPYRRRYEPSDNVRNATVPIIDAAKTLRQTNIDLISLLLHYECFTAVYLFRLDF
mmetsp:Transcript_17332/g.40048  ORF Transcript_17332/g.40048 Transcript_17332/m.40048 type:complete len:83 (+) Transcript_17332:833-1081(+)